MSASEPTEAASPTMDRPDANLHTFIKRRRRRRTAGILLVMALAAVPIAVLLSARAFDLSIAPAKAAAMASWKRSEGYLLGIGSRILLFSEQGTITIEAKGFEPYRRDIDKSSERRQIEAILQALPGMAVITVASPSDFSLFVDDVPRGTASQTKVKLDRGPHSVRIDGANIKPIQADIDIEGYDEIQYFKFETEPANSAFAIRTAPPDALIFLDGNEIGRGAYDGFVAPGEHEITVEREGYHGRQLRFAAEPDKNTDLGLIELSPQPATLSVASTPSGAAVLVDGQFRGTTPVEMSVPPLRTHRLVIRKTGYEPLTTRIKPRPGESIDRTFRLGSHTFEARVTTNLEARVTVNGVAKGFTPAKVTVREGDRIAVSRDGYQTQSVVVDPVGGAERSYAFTMMRPKEFAFHQAPLQTTPANGIILRKFPPARFRIPSAQDGTATIEKQLTRPFYIGVREVTYRDYLAFDAQTIPRGLSEQHPVTNLTWSEAARFCNWLSEQSGLAPAYEFDDAGEPKRVLTRSLGYRLPTEAEWEAVSGFDFARGRAVGPYPWGESPQIPRAYANLAGREADAAGPGNFLFDHVDNHAVTAPVGSYAANFNGLFDLAGNVAEWVSDYHAPLPTLGGEPLVDPLGPPTGLDHLIKGSSFRSHTLPELAIESRTLVAGRSDAVGFRVARWIY